jgi:hypothetical protein
VSVGAGGAVSMMPVGERCVGSNLCVHDHVFDEPQVQSKDVIRQCAFSWTGFGGTKDAIPYPCPGPRHGKHHVSRFKTPWNTPL